MMGVAAAAAVVGAGVAVKSSLDAKKQGEAALNAQKDQNSKNTAFIQQQAELAREDIIPQFQLGQEARQQGAQAALDVFGQTIPQQAGVFQAGNVGAQQALLAGLPQIQNALLGQNVDLSGLQVQQLPIDTGFAQQQVPEFAASPIQSQAQIAAETLGGITTDADLFRAASQGAFKGVSADDQAFFGRHLANVQGDPSTQFVSDPSQRGFVGQEGGFNAQNEQKLANLLTQFQKTRG